MTSPLSAYPNKGRNPVDLTGCRFGKLAVIEFHHHTYGKYFWRCLCDCGKQYIARTNLLNRGAVKSCGCLKWDGHARRTHGKSKSKAFRTWAGIISRCTNPKTTRFENWGGRGITVCERWRRFENFYADMGDPPPGTSIDRVDNNGNYEPGNCKWSTAKEQGANKRPYQLRHEKVCDICGSLFRAVMPRAKYCSRPCHNKAALRQYYAKKGGRAWSTP